MTRRKSINFRGAGLFLFAKNHQGILHILLGQRKYAPYRGVFTVATGQSLHTPDKDKTRFFVRRYVEPKRTTALREAQEEILLLPPHQWPDAKELISLFSINLWFYDWENFVYFFPGKDLPRVQVGEPEVHSWDWVPTTHLPEPLFPGIPLLSPPLVTLIRKAEAMSR